MIYQKYFLLYCLWFTACATPNFKTEVTYFGEVDLYKNKNTEEKAKSLAWKKEYPVKVIQGKLPDGISILEGGRKIEITEKYKSKYEILGTVSSKHAYLPFDARLRANFGL
jgi:hypothetical protein